MRDFTHFTRVSLAALAIATAFPAAGIAADALLSGAIKSSAGQTLDGVTVSAKAEGSTITTSVFTDNGGNYYFPPLPEGKYQVWAQALTFATAKGNLDLSGVKHEDFVLEPFDGDFVRQLPGDEILAALPGGTPDDARMKTQVQKNCTSCHSASFPLQHKFDEAGWTAVLDLMKHINSAGVYKGPKDTAYATIDANEKELAAYLARARGPGPTSMKFNLRPRPSGEAARVVFKEYAVPVDTDVGLPYKYVLNDGSDWSLGTPSLIFGNNFSHDAVQDLDGNIWFTHDKPSRTMSIGRIDGKTGEFKAIKVNEPNGFASATHGIIRDQKGIIWFNTRPAASGGNPGGLAKLDPKTGQITVYVPPTPMVSPQGSLDFDSKGFIWVTTDPGAQRFDPVSEKFIEFKTPEYKTPHGEKTTYGIAGDHDGNGWWLDMRFDHVEFGDPTTNTTTEFQLPPDERGYSEVTAHDKLVYASYVITDYNNPYLWAQGPRRMVGDKNADFVWIADSFGGNLAKMDIHTKKIDIVPLPDPGSMQPYAVSVDKNHNVWTNLWSTDKIAKYDQTSHKWTLFDLPSRGTESRYISLLERDDGTTTVTIPSYRTDKVAVMSFRSQADIDALAKQAQ